MRRFCLEFLKALWVVLATLCLLEGGMALLLRNSALLAGPYVPWQFGTLAEKYYLREDRTLIQYMPECSQYDPELFYVYKPGSCRIQSREFDVTYAFNDLGLRGDAFSAPPPVAVLGDSEAMGWGVPREESFTGLIERSLGEPVANVAVSSYGTAREMLLLRRLKLPSRTLVIAYNGNDEEENAAFVAGEGRLKPRPREEYQAVVDQQVEKQRYFPGRHVLNLLDWARTAMAAPKSAPSQAAPLIDPSMTAEERQARLFLKTLTYFPDVLRDKRVLVVQISESYDANSDLFIKALKRLIDEGQAEDIPCRLEPVDLQPVFRPEFFYFLDGHLNARGHAAVTATLLHHLRP